MLNIANCSSIGIIITFYSVKIYVVLNDRPGEFVFRSVSILIFYTQWLTPWFTTCANSFIQIHYHSYGTHLNTLEIVGRILTNQMLLTPMKWNIMAHLCTQIRKLVPVNIMFCCWNVIRPSLFTINGAGHSGTGNCMDCLRSVKRGTSQFSSVYEVKSNQIKSNQKYLLRNDFIAVIGNRNA